MPTSTAQVVGRPLQYAVYVGDGHRRAYVQNHISMADTFSVVRDIATELKRPSGGAAGGSMPMAPRGGLPVRVMQRAAGAAQILIALRASITGGRIRRVNGVVVLARWTQRIVQAL